MISGVYIITTKHECGLYVGSAVNLHNRFLEHKRDLRKNKHHNNWLQKIYNKYGLDNLQFAIVSFCDKEELIEKEQFFIDKIGFDNLYNLQPTAGSNLGMKYPPEFGLAISKRCKGMKRTDNAWLGRKHTEESKAKMSAQRKGRKSSPAAVAKIAAANRGKKRTPEFCKRISEMKKGKKILNYKPRSQEVYDRIGLSNKGKKRSEETKKKMSDAKIGKPPSNTQWFKLIDPSGAIVEGFNLKDFARKNNISYGGLNGVVRGKQKQHKGWRKAP